MFLSLFDDTTLDWLISRTELTIFRPLHIKRFKNKIRVYGLEHLKNKCFFSLKFVILNKLIKKEF